MPTCPPWRASGPTARWWWGRRQVRRLVAGLGWTDALARQGKEGYLIRSTRIGAHAVTVIASDADVGALYGAFHFLRLLQTGQPVANLDIAEQPRLDLRLLNHWDNLDGTIERGYAGRSLWHWDELPGRVDPRVEDYARANASHRHQRHRDQQRQRQPDVADARSTSKTPPPWPTRLRPYGIRVFLSANFAAPRMLGGLPTADPLDPAVARWWKDKADEIYRLIPDFGGFLVKANSEGQPGPQDYGRTHADGANMLADALAPHGGIVMWRAFVYDAAVDADRVKRAYLEFVPLDGKFRDNVFVQVKNGPLDFQPREPFHPLFGAMPKTPLMAELQITQEYFGHSTHLVYLAPMWNEFLQSDTFTQGPRIARVARSIDGTLEHYRRTGIAGVANTGSDRNWTGHDFAQANWYAYGRLAWNPDLPPRAIADEWIRMTWGAAPDVVSTIRTHPARFARGVRRLHDAARAAPSDWRRSLRADAGERGRAARGLVRHLLPSRRRGRRRIRPHAARAAAPWISTTRRCGIDGTIRPRRPSHCCCGSTACPGTTS